MYLVVCVTVFVINFYGLGITQIFVSLHSYNSLCYLVVSVRT